MHAQLQSLDLSVDAIRMLLCQHSCSFEEPLAAQSRYCCPPGRPDRILYFVSYRSHMR